MVSVDDFDRFVFIVGAPRCGTTTLSHFLKEHPSVSFPSVKEPHFFAQNDLGGLSFKELKRRVEDGYLRRFFRSDPARRIGADASVTYLYAPERLEPVLKLWPDSRFVITLRNPLTMLPSLHRRLIYLGDETIGSFKEAWAAVPDRVAGRRIPRRCADPRWLRYDEAARFATYLERLFAVVGRERCLVLIYDDLVADPAGQYQAFMNFVGLPALRTSHFGVHRAGYHVRVRWLQRLLKRPVSSMTQILGGEKFLQRVGNLDAPEVGRGSKMVLSLRKQLLRWNRIPLRSQAPLPPSLHDAICRHFEEEIARLTSLVGRDLTHWLRSSCSVPGVIESPDRHKLWVTPIDGVRFS